VAASSSLYLKNAAVALLMVTPLVLLVAVGAGSAGTENDQPPIITIKETEGYTFRTGSAELSPDFVRLLDDSIAPKLRQLADSFRCDVVEVIGHTDGQAVLMLSNLDRLFTASADTLSTSLVPGSNADLGLMRAWAVAIRLRAAKTLRGLTFYGYSAGQAIDIDGSYAAAGDRSDRPERRRIELRLRRSAKITNATATR